MIAAPLASGLSCLVEDEMDLGCTSSTSARGRRACRSFRWPHDLRGRPPIGGLHITNDIARGLTTTYAHAERLKTSLMAAPSSADEREIIDVPQVGEEAPEFANHLPKSHLINIIQPRLEEIFEMIRARLAKAASPIWQAAARC